MIGEGGRLKSERRVFVLLVGSLEDIYEALGCSSPNRMRAYLYVGLPLPKCSIVQTVHPSGSYGVVVSKGTSVMKRRLMIPAYK